MEEVYTNLSRTGLTFEEAVGKAKAPLVASQNRSSSTELGSLEYLERLRKTGQVVASTSFRKPKDVGVLGINRAGSCTGAKFEYLGRTPYSLGEPSKTSKPRKASGSSSESNLRVERDRKSTDPSKHAEEGGSRKGSIRKSKITTSVKHSRNSAVSNNIGDDSSDELNLTSSSQPIESPEKRSARSSDRATGPPGSDSDDCEWHRKMHSSPEGARASSSSFSRKPKARLSRPKLRVKHDENSLSDGTPDKTKPKVKPRPAYGKGKNSNTASSSIGNNGNGSIARPSGIKEHPSTSTDRSRRKISNVATSHKPNQALLEEKRMNEETPRPSKKIRDNGVRKPKRFPMTRKAETSGSDDSGSDNDPLSMDRNDEIINRGGLAPFPMSSQQHPGYSRKPPSVSSTTTVSPKRGPGSNSKQSPTKRRRKSNRVFDILDIDEYSFTQAADRPDPKTLCPYCDMPFPPNPSPLLLGMLKRIPKYTDVRPMNPFGLKAPLLSYVSMCQRHQFETQLLPTALAAGWPTSIDFVALPSRVDALRERLEGVLYDKEKSVFWREMKKDIDKKGLTKVMGIAGQFNTFEKSQPGYYGEQGSVIISQTLRNLFLPESIDTDRVAPLTPSEFLQRILVPECAMALIQEDYGLGTSVECAVRTLRESSKYGTAMFPDLDNRDGMSIAEGGDDGQRVGEAMAKERVRARRKEIDAEERMEEGLEELERGEKRKNARPRGSRRDLQSNRGVMDSSEGSLRENACTKEKPRAATRGCGNREDVIELSDSPSVQTDASIASRTRKRRKESAVEVSAGAVMTAKSKKPLQSQQSKLASTTARSQPGFVTRPKANAVDLSSDEKPVADELDQATPRPSTRIRRDYYDSDLDIILPEEDNRYKKSAQDMTTKSNPTLKLISSVLPLQAAKARKTTKEARFRRTMWENDDSEMEESEGPSSPLPSDASRKRHLESLARKSSYSWLWSDPSTPSGTPQG